MFRTDLESNTSKGPHIIRKVWNEAFSKVRLWGTVLGRHPRGDVCTRVVLKAGGTEVANGNGKVLIQKDIGLPWEDLQQMS